MIEVIISGVKYPEVQRQLLSRDKTLTIEQSIEICRTNEASIAYMSQMESLAANTRTIDYIKKPGYNQKCRNCGRIHKYGKEFCPAKNDECHACSKMGHWKNSCLTSKFQKNNRQKVTNDNQYHPKNDRSRTFKQRSAQLPKSYSRKVDVVEQIQQDFDDLNFSSIVQADQRDEVYATVQVILPHRRNVKTTLTAKCDTGAQSNILPLRIYKRMFPHNINEDGNPILPSSALNSITLTTYTGLSIKHFGAISLECSHNGNRSQDNFFVADATGPAIFGLPLLQKLKLITLHCSVKVSKTDEEILPNIQTTDDLEKIYPTCFKGIGNVKGAYHIVLDPTVAPVIHCSRKCPILLHDEIKAELENMEALGVITKITEPTDWVSSLAYSRKRNGKLRICLDPKDLNTAIKRCHHRAPTLEEITHKFGGSTVFSKLDARHGYWSVKLDDESSRLTTFNSPFGRYCFQRMPFGLKMSQDVFQQKIDAIIEQCPGTLGIADDIAVFGKTTVEHDKNLHQLMKIAEANNLVFNKEKCDIKKDSIYFFGMVYDSQGVHPDPRKVEAIRNLEAPKDIKSLQGFLGLATYMGPFIPNLSQHTASLRELLKKDSVFEWTVNHNRDFENVRDMICKQVKLSYFSPMRKSTIQVDASGKGLGAVLIQEGQPIAFASKALTETEQRYANIEREMLAVVFGCERFHTYVYGQHFTVESDHKPLTMIKMKHLTAAPPRLQRMLLRLQHYDMEIRYLPGKDMLIADGLSRLPGCKNSAEIKLDVSIHHVQFSSDKLQELREKTKQDPELCQLIEMVFKGWPEKRHNLPSAIRPYWPHRDEISIEDGIVVKNDRIIIPKTMQTYILQQIHQGHQGSVKCKLRAKSCVFWHNIYDDKDNMVHQCEECQSHQRSQSHETLIQHEIPTKPWKIVGTDIFYFLNHDYLIITDYYSKFPFIRKMPNQSSNSLTVVKLMQELFSEQGVPERIVSDNGPHFNSQVFQGFAKNWGFDHITSSPNYPQSNGFIERSIQTVKNTMKKAQKKNSDINRALLSIRSTPISSTIPSPSELLYNRKLKGFLPVRIKNQLPNHDTIYEDFQTRQQNQKTYHDQHTHDLVPLIEGQTVRFQNREGNWQPAMVEQPRSEPRSYDIVTPTGQKLRRNRRHLIPSLQTPPVNKEQCTIPSPPTPSVDKEQYPVPSSPTLSSDKEKTMSARPSRIRKPPRRFEHFIKL